MDIGDNDSNQSDFVPLEINPGDSVTVQNLTGSNATLNYLTNFDAAPAGTIAAGASQTFTIAPVWLQSQGVSSVLITGGVYGN
ncbi:MAG TPA: hypothetical protein VF889_08515 [Bacteroidota bacterium]